MDYMVSKVLIKGRTFWVQYHPKVQCKEPGRQCRIEDSIRRHSKATKQEHV